MKVRARIKGDVADVKVLMEHPMETGARMDADTGKPVPRHYIKEVVCKHNGTVEGLNNKAKVISHKAYGFRTAKGYIRNLYHCMAELPLPKTAHTFA